MLNSAILRAQSCRLSAALRIALAVGVRHLPPAAATITASYGGRKKARPDAEVSTQPGLKRLDTAVGTLPFADACQEGFVNVFTSLPVQRPPYCHG
jgi:hypothetical protein